LRRRRTTIARLTASYINFYYAMLARQRLNVLKAQDGDDCSRGGSQLGAEPVVPCFDWRASGEDEPHLIKARLLANAALNE